MKAAAILGVVALATTSSFVAAAPPAAPAKKKDPVPALPAASGSMTLKVTPGTGGGPWSLRIENTGEVPLRIAADARLLSLELTPAASTETDPKKKAKAPTALKCSLPEDARPSTDEGRDLVVPSKRSWSMSFDPLFYCFSAKERALLVPGTSVKARFGFPVPAKGPPGTNPPFAVTPVGAAVGKFASSKQIEAADAFALTEAVSVMPPSSSSAPSADETPSPVTLTVPDSLDASRGVELATTVTLQNNGDRPITLLYRPDMLLFTASSPAGNVPCGFAKQVAAPIRELFTTVAVKGKTESSVLFTAICPAGTFDEPGVYRVYPRVDTTGASGRELGMKTWDGIANGKVPLLVRVRTPRKPALPTRPSLD